MNILFLSCYADSDFNQMIKSGKIISQAAQKFDKLFVKGFIDNGCKVDVILFYTGDNKLSECEMYHNRKIIFHCCRLEGNLIKRLLIRKHYVNEVFSKWNKKGQERIVVIDSLKPAALDLSKIAKKNNVKVVSIITDFRDLLDNKCSNIKQKFFDYLLTKSFYKQFKYTSLFVLLTDEMKKKLPVRNNAIIIEGLCDIDPCADEDVEDIEIDNCFIYSGALSKQFGIDNLVSAFIKADTAEFELHLYGSGDYVEEIKEISKKDRKIKYFGVIPNEQMIEVQKKAYCLVNPRPVGDEYTKYSFPSKTIEYMVSGRPVVTTKLPGIPQDYNDFLFFFNSDSIQGLTGGITGILKKDCDELFEFGKRAREYVITKKNNVIQTRKLLEKVKEKYENC
ncbi:MAG: glycosyltransferase family 4 protein [Firmicutes bacterium]|nr:glycosyltransferase family 4 protein [Bacillota bacterium]